MSSRGLNPQWLREERRSFRWYHGCWDTAPDFNRLPRCHYLVLNYALILSDCHLVVNGYSVSLCSINSTNFLRVGEELSIRGRAIPISTSWGGSRGRTATPAPCSFRTLKNNRALGIDEFNRQSPRLLNELNCFLIFESVTLLQTRLIRTIF